MENNDMRKYLDTAKQKVEEVGEFLLSHLSKEDKTTQFKSSEVDLVTEYDREAEERIVNYLSDIYPHHSILAEERSPEDGSSEYRWIIDPIDGTTNFAHGHPHFAISLGLEVDGDVKAGVVYQPAGDEMFSAVQGEGAFLNGEKINTSDTHELKRGLLATGFPYRFENMERNMALFRAFMYNAQGIRRAGSASLDLCYVACGRLDGFWEFGLSAWDIAAGKLIVQEAGGTVTNFSGEPIDIYRGEVVATNGRIHGNMIDILIKRD